MLVTGEAVVLDLRPASFAIRALSYLLDGAIMVAIQVLVMLPLAFSADTAGLDDGFIAAGLVLAAILAFIGYPVLCELLMHGRSVGRLATGTRVVRSDGGPVHMRQSLLRALMAMLEIWSFSGALAFVVAMIDPRSRRLGDMLAGTWVVQERLRAPMPTRYSVPPSLEQWARTSDVGRLPLLLAQDIRSHLPRVAGMNATSRRELGRDLVRQVMPFVAPGPPPGTDPELFLQALLAVRSDKDEQRLRAADARSRELAADVRRMPFGS
jgi:uncharacterized RDD family membrane protein YckC